MPTHPSVPHSVTLARHSNSLSLFLALQNMRNDLSGHQWGSNEKRALSPYNLLPLSELHTRHLSHLEIY